MMSSIFSSLLHTALLLGAASNAHGQEQQQHECEHILHVADVTLDPSSAVVTAQASSSSPNVTVGFRYNDCHHTVSVPCYSDPTVVASATCGAVVDASVLPSCSAGVSTQLSTELAVSCPRQLEDYLDRPVRDYLRSLQWLILEESTYLDVRTWKFPFDAWVYNELLSSNPPDVLIEVGNRYGGSANMFASLFDSLGAHTRIIGVDIDHSELHEKPLAHPRITFIEGDALEVFPQVAALINPTDTVFVIEDASHKYEHTLAIMRLYGELVTVGNYMIIEDTILHNGVENPYFDDPGAHLSVKHFLEAVDETGCEWISRRDQEKFVVTWNPTGFLQRVAERGQGDCSKHDRYTFSVPGAEHDKELFAACPKVRAKGLQPGYKALLAGVARGRIYDASESVKSVNIKVNDVVYQFPPRSMTPNAELLDSFEKLCTLNAGIEIPEFATICGGLVQGRVLASNLINARLNVEMLEDEISTPLHIDLVDPQQVASIVPHYIRKREGVAVLKNHLDENEVMRLRQVVVARPEFSAAFEASTNSGDRSRYLQPLCESTSNDNDHDDTSDDGNCEVWDEGFLKLITDSTVMQSIREVLGHDCVVDNTVISVSWPGHNTFGPHFDRPFDAESSDSESSSTSDALPPNSYPVSMQVIWTLDNFTAANGAFFYVKGGDGAGNMERAVMSDYPLHTFPKNGKLVTTQAGGVIVASGNVLHGAAPNFSPRPRLAFLVQYVRKIVTPLHSYPSFLQGYNKDTEKLLRISHVHPTSSRPAIAVLKLDPVLKSLEATRIPAEATEGIPLHAFGTGGSFAGLSHDETVERITAALDAGFRHFDLAEMYGNQKAVGSVFEQMWGWGDMYCPNKGAFEDRNAHCNNRWKLCRSDVFITSKVWATNMNEPELALRNTLQDLRICFLDLWLIHWPVPLASTGITGPSTGLAWPVDESGFPLYAAGVDVVETTWRQMESSVEKGLAKNIGVCNANGALLQRLLMEYKFAPPVVLQVESHPLLPQMELRKMCRENGVLFFAYSPLASLAQLRQLSSFATAEELIRWALIGSGSLGEADDIDEGGYVGGVITTSRDISIIKENIGVSRQGNGTRIWKELAYQQKQLRTTTPAAFQFLFW